MLLPTSVDVLRCVERTLQTVISPVLTGPAERSAAASMGHLLRHVALRIEHEGGLFAAEINMVRPILHEAVGVIEHDFPADGDSGRVREGISATLNRHTVSQGYRDVSSLAAEVSELRQAVCDALELIQRQPSLPPSAQDLYESLKRYVAWQIDGESKMIDAAFEGFGPRR